jgi:hypothetical protein
LGDSKAGSVPIQESAVEGAAASQVTPAVSVATAMMLRIF